MVSNIASIEVSIEHSGGGNLDAKNGAVALAELADAHEELKECGHGKEKLYDFTVYYSDGNHTHETYILCDECAKKVTQLIKKDSWQAHKPKQKRGYHVLCGAISQWLQEKLGIRRSTAKLITEIGLAILSVVFLLSVYILSSAVAGLDTLKIPIMILAIIFVVIAQIYILPQMIIRK